MKRPVFFAAAVLVLTSAHAQQPKTAAPSSPEVVMSETQRLELENASLKLSIIQQQAQQAASPIIAKQQETVKAILAANPGFRYDDRADRFVRLAVPLQQTAPDKR